MHGQLNRTEIEIEGCDWGVKSQWTVEYAVRLCTVKPVRKLRTAREFVRACQRLFPVTFGFDLVDGRLVGVAWNFLSPTKWAEKFASFLTYWNACAGRPEKVGSSHNPDPQWAFGAWCRGIPASIVRTLVQAQNANIITNEQIISLLSGRRSRLWSAARACRRHSLMSRQLRVTNSALWKLGKLCPELQEVAIRYFEDSRQLSLPDHESVMHARDIEWTAVAAAQKDLVADRSGRVRAAMAQRQLNGVQSARAIALLQAQDGCDLADKLAPSYPGLILDKAARIALGASPQVLANDLLSKKEAHEWLLSNKPLAYYFCEKLSQKVECNDPGIAKWLVAVDKRGGLGALFKKRIAHGPAGTCVEYTYADRIDGLVEEDLVRGNKTSVEEAFRHAMQRDAEAWNAENADNHRVLAKLPTALSPLPSEVMLLNTPAKLVREGQEMDSCVGQYTRAVEDGRSLLFHIQAGTCDSTLELCPHAGKWEVNSHLAYKNTKPSQTCKAVVARWLGEPNA